MILGAEEPDGSIKEPGNAALAMHQELRRDSANSAAFKAEPIGRNGLPCRVILTLCPCLF
jgi:hypothetical protein